MGLARAMARRERRVDALVHRLGSIGLVDRPTNVGVEWQQGGVEMTDDSDTSAQDESSRINPSRRCTRPSNQHSTRWTAKLWSAGLLVTYGIAAVAVVYTNKIQAAWMFVSLPVPAWILLSYNAILWSKVALPYDRGECLPRRVDRVHARRPYAGR